MTEQDIFDELKYSVVRNDSGVFYHDSNRNWHRENDEPAIIWADGSRSWWCNGVLHRENDLPAVIYTNGTKYWYVNGRRHRDHGLPAVIYTDGTQAWWCNGEFIK